MSDRWTAAGGIALAVGLSATASPRLLVRVFGLPPQDATGGAALAWRMFGIRTALIGGAVLQGNPSARAAVLPVQLLDQAVFAQAMVTRSVPLRSGLMAVATSAALIALSRPATARPAEPAP